MSPDPIRARLDALYISGDVLGPMEMRAALRAVLDKLDTEGYEWAREDMRRVVADNLGVTDE